MARAQLFVCSSKYPLISMLLTILTISLSFPHFSGSSPTFTLFDSNSNDNETNLGIDELETNVPLEPCDHMEQADLTTVYINPTCEKASQGYCGIRKNQNYTLMTRFIPKVDAKRMFVRVTTRDPLYGWETLIWPEFSVCNRFNITCPHSISNPDPVRTYVLDTIPDQVPPMRALVRVRLFGVGEDNIRRVFVCRQFNVQVY